MLDVKLVRDLGNAERQETNPVTCRLFHEQPDRHKSNIHLISQQSVDGPLAVGDSHHYDPTPLPLSTKDFDRLIVLEMDALLDLSD